MSGRSAAIRQSDVERLIRAAKKHGAASVEVRAGHASVIIHLADDKPVAEQEQITL